MAGKQAAGQYEIKTLTVTGHNGFVMDVSGVIAGIEIYEDIYSTSMTAKIGIVTTEDLVAVIPIIGQETVQVEIDHPGGSNPITLNLVVSKITGYERDNMSSKFILECVTQDYILNYSTKISQYFEGPASQIAQEVHGLIGFGKQLQAIPSQDEQKLVVPNFSAFKTINWMASKAFTETTANYVFFEKKDSYMFAPLSEMTQQSPKVQYVAGVSNVVENPNGDDKMIQNYKLASSFDVIKNITKGFYGSRATKVDILHREYTEINYDYWSQYSENKTLTPNTLFDVSGQGMQIRPDLRYVVPENKLLTYHHDDVYLRRKSQMQLYDNLKIELTVFGETSLGAGDLVDLSFPILNPLANGELNDYLSGSWMVTAIKHRFEQNSYYCDMECIRDSTNKPLPQKPPQVK